MDSIISKYIIDIVNNRKVDIVVSDEEELLFWCYRHKIIGLVFSNIFSGKINCSKNFSAKICSEFLKMKKRSQKIFEVEKYIFSQHECPEMCLLKGSTSYRLLKKDSIVKFSSDIDILLKNSKESLKFFLDCGFEILDVSCDIHEYQKLFLPQLEIVIELHSFFPVLSLKNETTNNTAFQNGVNISELRYSDLQSGIILDHQIPILGMEAHAFILCLHVFKSFSWEPYAKPVIRAEEIHELYLLFKHKKFIWARFIEYIELFIAQDAVGFITNVFSQIYEDNPLSCLNLTFPSVFKIANDKFGYWVPYSRKDFFSLLITKSSFDFVIERGTNQIKVGREYAVKEIGIQYTDNDYIDSLFHFKIKRVDQKNYACIFTFDYNLEEPLNCFLHIGKEFGHLWIVSPKQQKMFGSLPYSIDFIDQKGSAIIQFAINENQINKKGIHVIIGAGRGYETFGCVLPIYFIDNDSRTIYN